jgi:heme-degrading monooxygenase HmoA
MFIAMNRFQVKMGCEHDFEHAAVTRISMQFPAFTKLHLLKGPERDDDSSPDVI